MGQIFSSGADAMDTSSYSVVAPTDVIAGNEYIWEYGVPAVTFSVISADTMTGFVQGLLNLDAYIQQVAPGTQEPPVTITGISIDTGTGNIWVRARVNAMPIDNTTVQQAGVSPWAIAALIGGLFAIIGAAVTLRYVYEVHQAVFGPPAPPGQLDPCTNPGVVNYIQCLARESKWFVFGFVVGVIALVVFLLVKFGPKEGIQ